VPGRAEIPATDDELLAACGRGEQAAWDALVERYSALIYSIPLKYGLPEADAADVFQAVCITLLEKLGSIRDPRGLPAWIITTATRQCWAQLRQRTKEASRAGGDLALEEEPPDPDPLPEDELLALERQQQVRSALHQLPGNCRRLLEALFSDDARQLSYQELAEDLGVPLNSLGPTRARCLSKLRKVLDAGGYWRRNP
jgi:RNA polymerase sigma factor (sigma-70 family)